MPPAARKVADQNTELPLEPIEPRPEHPDEMKFKVRIYPVIFQGAYSWRWELLSHTGKTYVGDFTGFKDADSYGTEEMAVEAAQRHINNIRHVAGLKLNQPEEKIIEF